MKKVIAIVLSLVVVLGLVACAANGNTEETTLNTEDTTVSAEETTATELTVAATFAEAFKTAASDASATTNSIATALSTNSIVAFAPMVQDMEAGFLAGFNADITGFKACTAFLPMIGTIPFVSYVFELEEGADVDAFVTTLKDNANLRWNICTAAEEMLVETEGNKVFFIMAPLSFQQEETPEVEGGEVEGGDVAGDMAVEGGVAAYDPEAETAEETTVA